MSVKEELKIDKARDVWKILTQGWRMKKEVWE